MRRLGPPEGTRGVGSIPASSHQKAVSMYLPHKATEERIKKAKEGGRKLREALLADYLKDRNRKSGLPKDWRNRIFK